MGGRDDGRHTLMQCLHRVIGGHDNDAASCMVIYPTAIATAARISMSDVIFEYMPYLPY